MGFGGFKTAILLLSWLVIDVLYGRAGQISIHGHARYFMIRHLSENCNLILMDTINGYFTDRMLPTIILSFNGIVAYFRFYKTITNLNIHSFKYLFMFFYVKFHVWNQKV